MGTMIARKYKVYHERPVNAVKLSEYNVNALVALSREFDAYDEAEIFLKNALPDDTYGTYTIMEVFVNINTEDV